MHDNSVTRLHIPGLDVTVYNVEDAYLVGVYSIDFRTHCSVSAQDIADIKWYINDNKEEPEIEIHYNEHGTLTVHCQRPLRPEKFSLLANLLVDHGTIDRKALENLKAEYLANRRAILNQERQFKISKGLLSDDDKEGGIPLLI